MTATDPLVRLTNLVPDPQDDRDYIYEWDPAARVPLIVDLRDWCSAIENQLSVGSCTANATVGAAEMFLDANDAFTDLSRLFNYYTSRELVGAEWLLVDKGSSERMALRAAKRGICRESMWPYDPARYNDKPSDTAYADAPGWQAQAYYRLQTWANGPTHPIGQIKHALAAGFPVLIGLHVGRTLYTLKPADTYRFVNKSANPLIGGHEVLIVGYDDTGPRAGTFLVRNSWGEAWGDRGYFRMLQAVVDVDVLDIWVMKGFAGFERVGANLLDPAPGPSANAERVAKAFRALFGREPDPAGLAYWTAQLDAGMDELTFRQKVAWSLEFLTGHWDEVMSLYVGTEAFKSKYGGG